MVKDLEKKVVQGAVKIEWVSKIFKRNHVDYNYVPLDEIASDVFTKRNCRL